MMSILRIRGNPWLIGPNSAETISPLRPVSESTGIQVTFNVQSISATCNQQRITYACRSDTASAASIRESRIDCGCWCHRRNVFLFVGTVDDTIFPTRDPVRAPPLKPMRPFFPPTKLAICPQGRALHRFTIDLKVNKGGSTTTTENIRQGRKRINRGK